MTSPIFLQSRVPGGLWLLGLWVRFSRWAHWYPGDNFFPFWVDWLVEVDEEAKLCGRCSWDDGQDEFACCDLRAGHDGDDHESRDHWQLTWPR